MILVRGRGDYQAQLLYSYSDKTIHLFTGKKTERWKNVLEVLAKMHFNLDGHDGEKFSYRITMKDYLKKTQ